MGLAWLSSVLFASLLMGTLVEAKDHVGSPVLSNYSDLDTDGSLTIINEETSLSYNVILPNSVTCFFPKAADKIEATLTRMITNSAYLSTYSVKVEFDEYRGETTALVHIEVSFTDGIPARAYDLRFNACDVN